MKDRVKLNQLDDALARFEYPVERADVVASADLTLVLADGTERLADIVEQSSVSTFESVDELSSEVMSLLPQHAVGEPHQSEGDG